MKVSPDLERRCLELAGLADPPAPAPPSSELADDKEPMATNLPVVLILPYPPTVNTYWRHVGSKVLVSRTGRQYRKAVEAAVLAQGCPKTAGRLWVRVLARCPDRRARDIDNILKALLDALGHAGVYENDSQIDSLQVERRNPKNGGEVMVIINRHETRVEALK